MTARKRSEFDRVDWKAVADIGKAAAEKFVAKVDFGRARSVETYADLKGFLAAYR